MEGPAGHQIGKGLFLVALTVGLNSSWTKGGNYVRAKLRSGDSEYNRLFSLNVIVGEAWGSWSHLICVLITMSSRLLRLLV